MKSHVVGVKQLPNFKLLDRQHRICTAISLPFQVLPPPHIMLHRRLNCCSWWDAERRSTCLFKGSSAESFPANESAGALLSAENATMKSPQNMGDQSLEEEKISTANFTKPWQRKTEKNQSRFLGRGCDEAIFSEKKGFSVKRGRQFSEWGVGLARISTGKAIQ